MFMILISGFEIQLALRPADSDAQFSTLSGNFAKWPILKSAQN
jgi:hypothetical protein